MILSISKAPVLATLLIGVKRRLQIEDIILYVFSYSKVCVLKKFLLKVSVSLENLQKEIYSRLALFIA